MFCSGPASPSVTDAPGIGVCWRALSTHALGHLTVTAGGDDRERRLVIAGRLDETVTMTDLVPEWAARTVVLDSAGLGDYMRFLLVEAGGQHRVAADGWFAFRRCHAASRGLVARCRAAASGRPINAGIQNDTRR